MRRTYDCLCLGQPPSKQPQFGRSNTSRRRLRSVEHERVKQREMSRLQLLTERAAQHVVTMGMNQAREAGQVVGTQVVRQRRWQPTRVVRVIGNASVEKRPSAGDERASGSLREGHRVHQASTEAAALHSRTGPRALRTPAGTQNHTWAWQPCRMRPVPLPHTRGPRLRTYRSRSGNAYALEGASRTDQDTCAGRVSSASSTRARTWQQHRGSNLTPNWKRAFMSG